MTLIYTVERFPAYWPVVEPLWLAAQTGTIAIATSELTVLEVLVKPLKSGNARLLQTFEHALFGTGMRLLPITQAILRDAAQLRATTKLRTPDAIHAATARQIAAVQFISNDSAFRGISGLATTILDDLLTP